MWPVRGPYSRLSALLHSKRVDSGSDSNAIDIVAGGSGSVGLSPDPVNDPLSGAASEGDTAAWEGERLFVSVPDQGGDPFVKTLSRYILAVLLILFGKGIWNSPAI